MPCYLTKSVKLWKSDTSESLLKSRIIFPLGSYDCIKTEKKEVCEKGTSRIENEVGDFLCILYLSTSSPMPFL